MTTFDLDFFVAQQKSDHAPVFLLFCFSFAKKEDIKDFWLAQGLNEAIPLLEVYCLHSKSMFMTLHLLREEFKPHN